MGPCNYAPYKKVDFHSTLPNPLIPMYNEDEPVGRPPPPIPVTVWGVRGAAGSGRMSDPVSREVYSS